MKTPNRKHSQREKLIETPSNSPQPNSFMSPAVTRTPIKLSQKKIQAEPFLATFPQEFKVSELTRVENEFRKRYPMRREIHLKAIIEHAQLLLDRCGISSLALSSKSFSMDSKWTDGLLQLFSPDIRLQLSDLLASYSGTELDDTLHRLIPLLFDTQRKSNLVSTCDFASMLFVQVIIGEFRDRITLFGPLNAYLLKHSQFRSNPALGNTLIWIMAQSPILKDDEMNIWCTFCLSSFDKYCTSSASSFQNLSLDYMETVIAKKAIDDHVRLEPSSFVQLLQSSLSNASLLSESKKGNDLQRRLFDIYSFVKENLFKAPHRYNTVEINLFHELYKLIGYVAHDTLEEKVIKEASLVIASLLARNHDIYTEWQDIYPKTISTSKVILEEFKECTLYDGKLDNLKFFSFIRKLKSFETDPHAEVEKVFKNLMKLSSRPWYLIALKVILCLSILLLIAAFGIFYYGCMNDPAMLDELDELELDLVSYCPIMKESLEMMWSNEISPRFEQVQLVGTEIYKMAQDQIVKWTGYLNN